MLVGMNYAENGGLTGAGSGKVTAGSRAQVASERSASDSRDETEAGGGSRKLRSRRNERRHIVLVFSRPDSDS